MLQKQSLMEEVKQCKQTFDHDVSDCSVFVRLLPLKGLENSEN